MCVCSARHAGFTVLLVLLLQASRGVVAATPYAVVTLVELPDDAVSVTTGRPVSRDALQGIHLHMIQAQLHLVQSVVASLLCIGTDNATELPMVC